MSAVNVAPAEGRGGSRYRALLKQHNVRLERRGATGSGMPGRLPPALRVREPKVRAAKLQSRLRRSAICQLVAEDTCVAPDLHHFDPGTRPVKFPYFGHKLGVFENVPAPADHAADILAVHMRS